MRINLIINDQCQLNCDHCCVKGKCEKHLTCDEWKMAYNTLTELGEHIHIAGREPFINTAYQNFIQDNRFTYSVVTNGIGLKQDLPDLDKFNKIVISWDAYHGCLLPRDLDLKTTVIGVSTTLTCDNWYEVLKSVCDANLEYGIYDFYFAPVIPLTPEVVPDLISAEDLKKFYSMLWGWLERGFIQGNFTIDVKGPYTYAMKDFPLLYTGDHGSIYLEHERHCRGGFDEITICPDGAVLPCFFMFTDKYQDYAIGNILSTGSDILVYKGMENRRKNINDSHHCAYDHYLKKECEYCYQKCPLWVTPCLL